MEAIGILFELGLIISIAAVLALLGRLIRQPTIIAYLITGIIAGPLFFGILHSTELIKIFAHLGITFLLFIVGLSLDFRVLKEAGPAPIITGLGQALITSIVGFYIAIKFGLAPISAFYIAAALGLSSTVVVVNLMTEKKETDTLHGQFALGILIVQDFLAAALFMVVPIFSTFTGAVEITPMLIQLFLGGVIVGAVFLFSSFLIPKVLSVAARNQEVLFLFSLSWAFVVALLFFKAGFSIEIGALIAGMSLASSNFSSEISGKIKGMREFFVVIHLVFFGSLLAGPITTSMTMIALVLSLLVLIGNPIIIMSFMKLFGYKKKTNFLTGITIAQISELSLILVFLGFVLGAVPQSVLSITILIALMTITLSSYSIYYSQSIYKLFSPLIGIFDGRGQAKKVRLRKNYDIILFGYNRIGFNLVNAFRKTKRKFLIVDYNPKTIRDLQKSKIDCVYGDANDIEFLNDLNLERAKIVVSTIPELETNLTILDELKGKNVLFIPTSHEIIQTQRLYRAGADYVIMPHFLGGEFMASLFLKGGLSKKMFERESKKQQLELAERFSIGHEHPRKDFHGA